MRRRARCCGRGSRTSWGASGPPARVPRGSSRASGRAEPPRRRARTPQRRSMTCVARGWRGSSRGSSPEFKETVAVAGALAEKPHRLPEEDLLRGLLGACEVASAVVADHRGTSSLYFPEEEGPA